LYLMSARETAHHGRLHVLLLEGVGVRQRTE
jgi:hypothetical protein